MCLYSLLLNVQKPSAVTTSDVTPMVLKYTGDVSLLLKQ